MSSLSSIIKIRGGEGLCALCLLCVLCEKRMGGSMVILYILTLYWKNSIFDNTK